MKDPRPLSNGNHIGVVTLFDFTENEAYHKALYDYVDFLKVLCVGAGLKLEEGSSFNSVVKGKINANHND